MAEAQAMPVATPAPSNAVPLRDAPIIRGSSQPPLSGQAKIDQMAADAQDNTDAAAKALSGFSAQINAVSSQLVKSAQEAATAQEAAKTTELLAAQKAQKATLDQATTLGTNPDAANFALNKIAQEYQANNARAQKFAENVAYASDISNITDNPLKYIGSLITLELNQTGQASAQSAAARSFQQYQGLNNMTQEYGKTQAAISQSLTAASVEQLAKVSAFNLNHQAHQASLQSLQLNSQNVLQALKLQNEPFDIERMRQASQNDAERLRIAREQASKSNIEMDLRIAAAKRADAREARQQAKFDEAEQMEKDMVSLINSAAEATGIPMHFNSVKELTMARSSPEFKDKIDTLYHIGLQTAYSTRKGADGSLTPSLSISDSPTKTYGFVKGMGAKLSPGQQPIIDLIGKVNQEIQQSNPAAVKMKPAEYANTLDTTVKGIVAQQYKNINNNESNIYAPPPLSTYLSNQEFVAGAPNIAAQMKMQADMGVKGVDFGKLTTALTEAAKTGKLPLTQIDNELKFFAAKTMAINNSLRRYDETAGLPAMRNMNVTLTLPDRPFSGGGDVLGIFGGDETVNVDLADDNKRAAYLNKVYSRTIPDVLRQQAAKTGAKK